MNYNITYKKLHLIFWGNSVIDIYFLIIELKVLGSRGLVKILSSS